MELQEKILQHFEGKVVRKDLTSLVKGNAVVPTYVLEYLLGQNCAVNDEEIIRQGIEKVKDIIRNNFVYRSEAELVKSMIREKGAYKIIDKLTVILNDNSDIYEASFANLGISRVPISTSIVKKHKKLLSGGGVWSIISMAYDTSEAAESRWLIESLKPIQVSGVDLEDYISKRKEFTTEEWLDLLVHSIGLDPEYFNRRGKLIQLSRLITNVENNYNFIELGPKETGKSHIFSELSPHGVLVSGGDVSSASLFVSNVGKGNKVGLVGYWDVVCLDEFEQVVGSRKSDGKMVNILQNYMANKSFNRGKETFPAYASMAFIGNTKKPVPYLLKNSHLFESIPEAYIKGAFLDRLHIYVPGWEVNKLKEKVFSSQFGFIVDYLAEILKEFRKLDYSTLVDEYVNLDPSFSGRDKMGVRKTFSGLVKLIYPDRKMTREEALELIYYAVEGRKRVKDQLYILDPTFTKDPVFFKYTEKSSGKIIEVETLENLIYKKPKKDEEQDKENEDVNVQSDAKTSSEELKAKEITIRDNQTGISYNLLFGAYLKGATSIKLIDPYVRHPYQFKNLMEFCIMLVKNKDEEEVVNLTVTTWNSQEYMQTSENNFEEIVEELQEVGVNLSYEFEDVHDRSIETDNGWKIILGRGLDIFEPREGFYNLGDLYQERRKCKNCVITFVKHS